MRWITVTPKYGDIKVVRRFLLFPKSYTTMNNEFTQTRWLENANLKYERVHPGSWMGSAWLWKFRGFED